MDFATGQIPIIHSLAPFFADARPTVRWAAPAPLDTVSYEFWLTNLDLNTRVMHLNGLESASVSLIQPLAPATYAVWVRGNRADGTTTPWSAAQKFTVLTPAVLLTSGQGVSLTPRPVLTWSGVAGATGYDIRIYAAETETPIYRSDNVQGLTHVPLQNLPAGELTVFVRAVKGSRPLSAWGSGANLSLRLPPSQLRLNPVQVSWESVPFAVSYTFELRNSRGTLVVPRTTLSETAFDLAEPLPPGQYSLRVLVTYGDVTSEWSPSHQFELFHPAVSITSSDAPTADATPVITWVASPGAFTYEMIVTTTDAVVYRRRRITGTSHQVDVPLSSGWHSFYVVATFADGSRTSQTMPQRVLIGPAPALTYDGRKLSWGRVNDATRYELRIDLSGSPGQFGVIHRRFYNIYSYTLPRSLPDGLYIVWVRAIRREHGQLYVGAWNSLEVDLRE